MTNSARRSPPDYPVPGLSGTARWRARQWCGPAMLVPTIPAHIDPLPAIGRPAPAPAAIVVAGVDERCSEEEAVVVPEESVAADEGPAVPAGTSEARPDRRDRMSTRLNSSHANISY